MSLAVASAVLWCGHARAQVATELRCSLSIRPLIVDPASGERVPASPDDFLLRSPGGEAAIHAERGAWTVRASAMRFEYELVDRRTGAVVVRETASLSCAREPIASPPVPLLPGRIVEGDTRGAPRSARASCGGGPERWHVLRLSDARRVTLRLASTFDAAVEVRAGSIQGAEVACRDESARFETLDLTLPAGTYLVAVGSREDAGRYRLQVFEHAPDPDALSDAPRAVLLPGAAIDGVLSAGPSRHAGRCGGQRAHEHVYALHLDERRTISAHLESRFDAAISLRGVRGDEITCGVVLGYPGEVRLPRASATLAAGDYLVVVDGATRRSGTGWYRLSIETR